MFQFKSLVIACSLALASNANSANPKLLWSLEKNLAQPESVTVLPNNKGYLVSNINGDPGSTDGNGYISLVNIDGSLKESHWVTGLDAPKGMAVSQGKVYIADLQQIHIVELSSGEHLSSLSLPDAKFLNDVTANEHGDVFVSDMLGGTIYKVSEQSAEVWLEHPDIPIPNGLEINGESLILGNWGKGMHNDFTTDEPGALYRVSLTDAARNAEPLSNQFANIDGVAFHKNDVIVSDWLSGKVFRVNSKRVSEIANLEAGSADIAVNGDILLVPKMLNNRVDAYQLSE